MSTTACQYPLSATEVCGLQALGRCHECSRAYCMSHAAPSVYGGPSITRCLACNEAAGLRYAAEQRASQQRVENAQALIVELASKLAARQYPKPTPRSWGDRRLAPAWSVGSHSWLQPERWNQGDRETRETGVTSTGLIVPLQGAMRSEFAYDSPGSDPRAYELAVKTPATFESIAAALNAHLAEIEPESPKTPAETRSRRRWWRRRTGSVD